MGEALITRRGESGSDLISALLDGEKYGTSLSQGVNYQSYGCARVDKHFNENIGVLVFSNINYRGQYNCVIAIDWTSQTIEVVKNTFTLTPQVEFSDKYTARIRVYAEFTTDDRCCGTYFYPA